MKNYQVRLHKKAMKQLKKLPHEVLEKFDRLANDDKIRNGEIRDSVRQYYKEIANHIKSK